MIHNPEDYDNDDDDDLQPVQQQQAREHERRVTMATRQQQRHSAELLTGIRVEIFSPKQKRRASKVCSALV